MARKQKTTEGTQTVPKKPRSVEIAQKGIKTSADFSDVMSALITDVLSGEVSNNTCNAACNAAGRLLKMVDMEFKFARAGKKSQGVLSIAFDNEK